MRVDFIVEGKCAVSLVSVYTAELGRANPHQSGPVPEGTSCWFSEIKRRVSGAAAAFLVESGDRDREKSAEPVTAGEPMADLDEIPQAPSPNPYDPTSFDSSVVKAVAPPLVAGLAMLLKMSPLGFLFEGFHTWVHEFGHASVAWLSGRRALPLPFGWTNVEQEKSALVYVGVPMLLVTMAVAGWRERKAWPIVLAAILVVVQTYMTWFLPEDRGHMWMIFGGVGGEFYISAAMIGLFYFEFPEKFKWGGCRYVSVFIGSAVFFESFTFWRQVKHGLEAIPYGTMINGEDDGGGDMNILKDDYHWTQHQIIYTYNHLADACIVALVVVYVIFNLRIDRIFDRMLARCMAA
jgi:hypothetical protein